jgi:uncharacterized tellurite resistance protein B-like protein
MDRTIGDLAFLYLTFAHASDGAISGEEMRTLASKLRDWDPHATLESIGETLKTAVEQYKQLGVRADRLAKAGACADSLANQLEPSQRFTVLAQLREIAEADGTVTADEESMLAEIRRRLGP